MEPRYTASIKFALVALLGVFGLQVYRAAATPIGLKEAYLYDRFVRPTTRQALASELPDHDVLYSVLEKRSVGLFHVSPFAVRLPSLLFGILYLLSIYRIASLFRKLWFWFFLAAGILVPIRWEWYYRADGRGVALALLTCAFWLAWERRHLNWTGICMGLAITAQTDFAIPAAAVAVAILARDRLWWGWVEQVVIPAAVVAILILAVPLSHATAPEQRAPEWTDVQASNLQKALNALQGDAGPAPVRIWTVPGGEPIVNFYRAQHRLSNWKRAEWNDFSQDCDYCSAAAGYRLLPKNDAAGAYPKSATVIYQNADFLLARAPM